MTQSVLDRGHKVGEISQSLFLNGVNVNPKDPRASAKALEDTINAIEDGANVIYEAAFMYNEVIVYEDILVQSGSKWKVYEVKSSTSISETNIIDVSVQYYVISNVELYIEDISNLNKVLLNSL